MNKPLQLKESEGEILLPLNAGADDIFTSCFIHQRLFMAQYGSLYKLS